jgi:hypothetical protein
MSSDQHPTGSYTVPVVIVIEGRAIYWQRGSVDPPGQNFFQKHPYNYVYF